MGIVALEEVLDARERWQRGRHSGDYWVSVYGDPEDGRPWSWRFEGHHLSVTMTVAGQEVSPAPVFFGANRVQGGDLLIEYDTTDDGNHVHTVLRRPRGDFGGDVLAAHHGGGRR
jgi:hypothetical protein